MQEINRSIDMVLGFGQIQEKSVHIIINDNSKPDENPIPKTACKFQDAQINDDLYLGNVNCAKCMRLMLYKELMDKSGIEFKPLPDAEFLENPITWKIKDFVNVKLRDGNIIKGKVLEIQEDKTIILIGTEEVEFNNLDIIIEKNETKQIQTSQQDEYLENILKHNEEIQTDQSPQEQMSIEDVIEKTKQIEEIQTDQLETKQIEEIQTDQNNKSKRPKVIGICKNGYNLLIKNIAETFQNKEGDFIGQMKTDFTYKIIHRISGSVFFSGIPEIIILQSLAILNNLDCRWAGRKPIPEDLISQCKLAMIAAYKTVNLEYPIPLEETTKDKNQIKIKIKRRDCLLPTFTIKKRIKDTFLIKRRNNG